MTPNPSIPPCKWSRAQDGRTVEIQLRRTNYLGSASLTESYGINLVPWLQHNLTTVYTLFNTSWAGILYSCLAQPARETLGAINLTLRVASIDPWKLDCWHFLILFGYPTPFQHIIVEWNNLTCEPSNSHAQQQYFHLQRRLYVHSLKHRIHPFPVIRNPSKPPLAISESTKYIQVTKATTYSSYPFTSQVTRNHRPERQPPIPAPRISADNCWHWYAVWFNTLTPLEWDEVRFDLIHWDSITQWMDDQGCTESIGKHLIQVVMRNNGLKWTRLAQHIITYTHTHTYIYIHIHTHIYIYTTSYNTAGNHIQKDAFACMHGHAYWQHLPAHSCTVYEWGWEVRCFRFAICEGWSWRAAPHSIIVACSVHNSHIRHISQEFPMSFSTQFIALSSMSFSKIRAGSQCLQVFANAWVAGLEVCPSDTNTTWPCSKHAQQKGMTICMLRKHWSLSLVDQCIVENRIMIGSKVRIKKLHRTPLPANSLEPW